MENESKEPEIKVFHRRMQLSGRSLECARIFVSLDGECKGWCMAYWCGL